MGIHYDYKSTRGEKALKKEAKKKARIEQRRAKKTKDNPININEPKINKTIRRFKTEILMYLLFILGS